MSEIKILILLIVFGLFGLGGIEDPQPPKKGCWATFVHAAEARPRTSPGSRVLQKEPYPTEMGAFAAPVSVISKSKGGAYD
jgi:hypothetical protein